MEIKMINSIQSFQNSPRLATNKRTNAHNLPNFGATFSYKIEQLPKGDRRMQIKGKRIMAALSECATAIKDMIQKKAHPDTVAELEFFRMSPEVLDESKTNVSGCIRLSQGRAYTYRFLSILLDKSGKKCRPVNAEHLSDIDNALRSIEGKVKRYAKKQKDEKQKMTRRQALAESFKQCSGLLQKIREKGLNR